MLLRNINWVIFTLLSPEIFYYLCRRSLVKFFIACISRLLRSKRAKKITCSHFAPDAQLSSIYPPDKYFGKIETHRFPKQQVVLQGGERHLCCTYTGPKNLKFKDHSCSPNYLRLSVFFSISTYSQVETHVCVSHRTTSTYRGAPST